MSLEKLRGINEEGKQEKVKNDGLTHLGTGVDMNDISRQIDIAIKDVDRSGHFGCFGTTRVGKTRLIENIIEQDIRKGYNVVVIDPKGDHDLFSKIVQVAAESGRLEEVMLLTPIFPEYSIMLDPLCYYYMEDELVEHIISGIKAKEDYFIAIAQEVSQAIVSGLALLARFNMEKLNINFQDIKSRSDWKSLQKFKEKIGFISGSEDIVENLDQILSSPQEFFGKVSSSLRTTLSALTSGSTGQIIGKALVNEFIKRFEEGKGLILFCNTGSMLARRTSHIIGRVLVSMIHSLSGRFYASDRKLDPPLCLHVDEGHNILYKGIQELFGKGGGANVWVSFYTQSISQIEEEIGPEATKSIVDNINSWLYLRVNHPDTAQLVEDSSPLKKTYQPILSFGGGISMRGLEEKQILASQVLQLPQRRFYLRAGGKLYKGTTDTVSKKYLSVTLPEINS